MAPRSLDRGGGVRLRRLRPMGIGELACRGRQEAWKWLERSGLAGRGGMPSVQGSSLNRFLDRAPGRFFEGALSDETPALLVERWPGARESAGVAADAILGGRFDLMGRRALFFGDPVDWHLDPTSGRRAPRVHWSRLDPLDPSAVGDSKVIWELNRHQWLLQLGRAHRLTGDERYAAGCVRYVREWMRANPPGVGINWASSLEVALRLISWCWALCLLKGSAALSPDLVVQVVGGIEAHASHVERYLSRYFSPNTHLTGEALGLFYAGVVFPELRGARRWRALGQRILEEESERQILPDGVHFELATCYHRYTVEIYVHFLILAARNSVAVAPALVERVGRMLDFLLAIRRPDGSMPQMGDGDGGWLLPLARRTPEDLRGVFATAAALFGRPDCAWAAGGPAPETVWLLGASGARALDALAPAPPVMPASRLFGWGGYVVMRSGWGAHGHQLIFDVGPLGCSVSGGPGHADLLSIQCSAWGEPYLV